MNQPTPSPVMAEILAERKEVPFEFSLLMSDYRNAIQRTEYWAIKRNEEKRKGAKEQERAAKRAIIRYVSTLINNTAKEN